MGFLGLRRLIIYYLLPFPREHIQNFLDARMAMVVVPFTGARSTTPMLKFRAWLPLAR